MLFFYDAGGERKMEIEGFRDVVEFGRGGFGVVYRAYQPEFDRVVAIKVVLADVIDADGRGRFAAEAAAMGRLSGHPHIVPVYDAGFTSAGKPYLVMPFLGRGSAGDLLENRGRVAWQEVASIGVKIGGALETAHLGQVLHRDVKPDNILFNDYGEPQLADFGIARLQGGHGTTTGRVTASITYAAPEVLAGQRAAAASDVYSLAATLFTLLNGAPAFYSETDESMAPFLARVATQPPPDLAPLDVPGELMRVIAAGMAKTPEERPETAAEFARLLQNAQRALGLDVTTLVLPPGKDLPASGDTVEIAGDLRLPTPAPPTGALQRSGEDEPDDNEGGLARPFPWRLGFLVSVALLMLLGVVGALLRPTAPDVASNATSDVASDAAASPKQRCDAVAAPAGNDAAAGTPEEPLQTVNALMQQLQPGQTGCLASGTFEEIVNIDRAGTVADPIVLTSADPTQPAPTVRGQINILRSAENVVVEGLNIVGVQVPTIRLFGTRIYLRHNDITNDTGTCIYMGEPTNGVAVDVTIESNVIADCGLDELQPGHNQSGLSIGTSNNVRVAGNVIRDMAEWGIVMYPHAENTVIERNVIIRNLQNIHLGGDAEHATTGTQIQRNVLVPLDGGSNIAANWEGDVGGNNVVRANCLASEAEKSSRDGITYRDNVRAEPEFVGDTYLVAEGSACAGMGPTRVAGVAGLQAPPE